MPSPQGASHRAAQISITETFGHDPERAVEVLVRLLTRAGQKGAAGGKPAAADGDNPQHRREAISHGS